MVAIRPAGNLWWLPPWPIQVATLGRQEERVAAENENKLHSSTFFCTIRVMFWRSRTQTSVEPVCPQRGEGAQRCNPLLGTQANFYSHPFLITIVRDFSTPASLLLPSQAATGHSWSKREGASAPWQCRYSRRNAIALCFLLFYTWTGEVLPDCFESFIKPCTITV